MGDEKRLHAGPLLEQGARSLWLPRKGSLMTQDSKDLETALQPGSVPLSIEDAPPRRPYGSPRLVEWGSIVELTRGPLSGTVDGDFSGSGGV
jgi:hypothetical protein